MKTINFIIKLLTIINIVQSAKILGVFSSQFYSHYILGNVLLKELASRGHEVTMISSFAQESQIKNYRNIIITENNMVNMKNLKINLKEFLKVTFLELHEITHKSTYMETEHTLNNTEVQNLLKSNENFDLVIIEQFKNEANRGFQYHYNIPCIIFSTVGSNSWVNPLVGNPENPSYIPEFMSNFGGRQLEFFERLHNSFLTLADYLIQNYYNYPEHNKLLHKYFPNAPDITKLLYNTSLVLLNSHPSYSQPKPHLPNMIEVGGMHISPPEKISDDLQQFLDDNQNGVIYFSSGSNIDIMNLEQYVTDAIFQTFSKLKMKILWKCDNDTIQGQPKNIMFRKWVPQQAILAHPNVKLFITHGGLLSITESIYYGKPVLGIPIIADQEMNMRIAVNSGYGIMLKCQKITETIFSKALKEILSNSSYTENAKKRSKIMQDQPIKPLDSAVFWVEYVIRHKGAYHLRSAVLDLPWYKYLLLDVFFVIIIFILVIILAFYHFYFILRRFFNKLSYINFHKKQA